MRMKKYKNLFLSLLLIPVFFFSASLSVSAAENIFSEYKTWVEDGETSSAQWIEGTSSTNGNMYIDLTIDVSAESVRIYSNQGSVGYNAGLFVSQYPVVAGDVISFDLSSSVNSDLIAFGLKTEYSPNGIYSFTYNYIYDSSNVFEYAIFRQYQGNETVSFTASNDGYFYIFGFVGAEYQVDFTISNLTVNGNVIYNTEEILNFGNENTAGVLEDFSTQHEEFKDVLSEYRAVEQTFFDDFRSNQIAITSDITSWSWGGLISCANWVGETMTDYYNNMGDFRQYIIYPLMLGIALFFLGRGSSIIGHLYRKPLETHTHTVSRSFRELDGTKHTSTITFRSGGTRR